MLWVKLLKKDCMVLHRFYLILTDLHWTGLSLSSLKSKILMLLILFYLNPNPRSQTVQYRNLIDCRYAHLQQIYVTLVPPVTDVFDNPAETRNTFACPVAYPTFRVASASRYYPACFQLSNSPITDLLNIPKSPVSPTTSRFQWILRAKKSVLYFKNRLLVSAALSRTNKGERSEKWYFFLWIIKEMWHMAMRKWSRLVFTCLIFKRSQTRQ